MPHRSNDRGSLILKRKFRGVPPIRRATGTSDPRVVEQVDLMLAALYNQARIDILEAIALGRLHPLVALSRWRQGREMAMPPADVLPSLRAAWEAWAALLTGSDEHRRKISYAPGLLRMADRHTIEDVPRLLASYRTRAQASSYNHVRNYCRAFLHHAVGTTHPVYLEVVKQKPRPTGSREKGQPHDPALLLEVRDKLGLDLGAMLWTMAVTGMRNHEYWVKGFEVLEDRVVITSAKIDHRTGRAKTRSVPRWEPVAQPTCSEKTFRTALKEASGGRVGIYDLRRSFARWCEEAHIIDSNRKAYLGHGPKTVTDLYTFGELPRQIEGDAAKLTGYLRG